MNWEYSAWAVVFVFTGIILLKEYRRGRVYTPFFLVSTIYILFIVLGTFTFELLRDKPGKAHLLRIIGGGYLAFVIGLYLGRFRIFSFLREQRPDSYQPIRSRKLLFAFIGFCFLMVVLFFVRAGSIPLFSSNADEARLSAVSGSGYIRVFIKALPIVSLFLWYNYLTAPSKRELYLFLSVTIVTITAFILTGGRSESAILAGELVIIYALLIQKRFSLLPAVTGLFFSFFFLCTVGAYRHHGTVDTETLFMEFVNILTGRPAMLDLIFKNFNDFQWGGTYLSDIQKLLPGQQTGANVSLKFILFPGRADMPERAGINPTLLGEMFINYGYFGIFAGMGAFGFLLKKFYLKMHSNRNRESTILYVVVIMALASAILNGIGAKLVPLMISIFWTLFIGIIARKRVQLC